MAEFKMNDGKGSGVCYIKDLFQNLRAMKFVHLLEIVLLEIV